MDIRSGFRCIARPLLFAGAKSERRAVASGAGAIAAAVLLRSLVPAFEIRLLAGGAARIAALFCGSSVLRVETGYALPSAIVPVVVSAACSAVDFYCIVATLLAWRVGRRCLGAVLSVLTALVAAVPLTLFVNALRIAALAQIHAWVIPRFPPAYGPILHLTTGVAIFLPALIALNLLLEFYGNRHAHSPR